MSEYRSALRAARERIEHLEAQLPPRDRPVTRRVSFERLVLLLVIVLPIVCALTVGALAVKLFWRVPGVEVTTLPAPIPEAPPPAAPPEGLEWMTQTWYAPTLGGPVVTDRGPDGTRAIVGLMWDRTRETDGMLVVAFDHATLAPRWRSGPYPSFRVRDGQQAQYLAMVGDRVVVTDVRGGVHMLDPRTGEERASKRLPNAPFGACVSGTGAAARLILPLDHGWRAHDPSDHMGAALFPWEINRVTLALDPMTGRTTPAPPFTGCTTDHYCAWKQTDGCRDLDQRESAPVGDLPVVAHEIWRRGDDRVSLGTIDGTNAAAVGWDAPSRAVRWDAPLTSYAHARVPSSADWGVLAEREFFYLYVTAAGPARLVGRDSKSGRSLFDVEVPGSAIGTRLHDLTAMGSDAFVSLNEELLVFDGTTGSLRGRLGAMR